MNKEEALQDFFKALKYSLTNSSIYFQGHPTFKKSAEDLKEKISRLFNFTNPIKIGIASTSLFVDEKNFGQTFLFEELAAFFHFRKIKSIEIKDTLSMEELAYFLSQVSRPPREIFREGGMEHILEEQGAASIEIESLDYSQLLNAQGEAYKDIWMYLFKDAIEKKDAQKINQVVDNFARLLGKFKSEDLLENEELKENVLKFLDYLKDREQDKFYKCSKEMLKQIVRYRKIPQDRIETLKTFFKDLPADGLADALWEQIVADEGFDVLGFGLFARLIDRKQENEIARRLTQRAVLVAASKTKSRLSRKIKELFMSSDSQAVPQVYRHALQALCDGENVERGEPLILDEALLHTHYRLLMLNVLYEEKNKTRLTLISQSILDEWEMILRDKDFEFLKGFLEIAEKRSNDASFARVFGPLKKQILNFIETTALEEETLPHLEFFLNSLTESSLVADDYLSKIFIENKVNPHTLQLFFKFFPQAMSAFYACLGRRSSDMDFLKKVTESLKAVDSPLCLAALKYIFSFSPLLIKIGALKAMSESSLGDKEFLFSILKSRDVSLRREAFSLLSGDKNAEKNALEILLTIPSPFGIRNNILEENIMIIAEIDASGRAAAHLTALSRRRFFWNRNIRKTAAQALRNLHAGKD